MGGCCCCASNGVEPNNVPPLYHYPRASGVLDPLSSNYGPNCVISSGLLVDTNLDTTIPDTYRPPPAPMPYINLHTQTLPENRVSPVNKNGAQSTDGSVADTNYDKNVQSNTEHPTVKEVDDDLEKSDELKKPCEPLLLTLLEEEDVCPTCLEEYDIENPKIITKCEHHFHLACILEWMERSDTCPVCFQEMVFSTANESSTFETEVRTKE